MALHNMDEKFFVKTTTPVSSLSSEQKAQLNRKGNELFNAGDITSAARIFTTTGYSDGLTRVGDYFFSKNEKLTALQYYVLAKNNNNVDLIVKELSEIVRLMLD